MTPTTICGHSRLRGLLGGVAACGLFVVAVACQSAPLPPPVPPPAAPPLSPEPRPPPPTPVVEPADALLPLGPYRDALEGSLTSELSLLSAALEAPSTPPIGHAVVTLGDPAGRAPYRTVTVGFGRRPQPHRFGSTPPFVELLAESHREGERIREALSRLGRYLHADGRPISVRFRAFDALRLDEPIFGERFFVLVPGGQVAINDELEVTILRVIPMDEGDFIHMNMRGDGAIRAWWAKHRGSAELLRRWDGVLDPSSGG